MTDLTVGPPARHSAADSRAVMGGGAGSVNPLAEPPVTTVPGAIRRMEQIQSWVEEHSARHQHDGIANFNFLYHVITTKVLAWIEEGKFADAEFLTVLDVVFANRYFDALRAYDADPDSAPSAWEALFERREESNIAPMQFAVAGVNAHVNFDLPLAVVATCEQLGREPDFGTQRADYEKVNLVFAEEMEHLRQHFENRFERFVDEVFLARLQNVLGNFSVDAARDTAWSNAEILWSLRNSGGMERVFIDSLDRLVGFAGRGVLIHL